MPNSSSGAPDTLIEHLEGRVAILTISRPEARNALDDHTRRRLVEGFERLATDDAVRAVVLTGADAAFCAGGDIRGMAQRLDRDANQVAAAGYDSQALTQLVIATIADFPKPTIAAVNGAAAGLGCDLALACDFIIAAPQATFTMSYIKMGLVPDGGGLYLLPRRIGLARAKEMIFSGHTVHRDDALAMGLADRAGDADTLLSEAVHWAESLTAGSQMAIAMDKSMLNDSLESSRHNIFARGRTAQSMCYTSAEHVEAVRDFMAQRRKPDV